MQKYNDYYRLTEGYLRNYNQFRAALVNMQKTREMKLAELEECRVPIARYGECGGGGELTQPEAAAERIMLLKKEIHAVECEIIELSTRLEQIDIAIKAADVACQKVLQLRYIENRKWPDVSEKTGLSERHCRRLAAKGVWQVCEMLFRYRLRGNRNFQFVS